MAPRKRGLYTEPKRGNPNNLQDRVADFSYQSDELARLITEIWSGNHPELLNAANPTNYAARSAAAKTKLAAKGIFLEKPIVISEEEYVDGFSLADAGLLDSSGKNVGVVFVVPDAGRRTNSASLLETAKLLMAVTPNGI